MMKHRSRKLIAALAVMTLSAALFTLVSPVPEAEAQFGGGNGCLIDAHQSHNSGHNSGRINGIGEMTCTYNPAGQIDILVMQGKKVWWGTYSLQTTQGQLLTRTSTYVKGSGSVVCSPGTWLTFVKGKAAGPQGQAAIWSPYWATNNPRTLSCGGTIL